MPNKTVITVGISYGALIAKRLQLALGRWEENMIGVEPERRAIHEAGHAGFAFEVGIGVQYVEIRTHNAGFCEYEAGLNLQLEHNFVERGKAYILTQMGGMAAE